MSILGAVEGAAKKKNGHDDPMQDEVEIENWKMQNYVKYFVIWFHDFHFVPLPRHFII